MKSVLAQARTLLSPTPEEIKQSKKIEGDALARINRSVSPAKAVVGGSGAKNTFLRNQHDIDIFVLYPYTQFKNRSAEISDLTEEKLKKAFKLERIHGSRDYFRTTFEGKSFEIIPILAIANAAQAVNITDISPLHSRWVKKRTTKELQDQIRLLKAFCKSAGIYGAESYIRGFSGYVCEILTVRHKSFIGVLKASQKWLPGDVIDVEKLLKGKPAFTVLNKSKLQSPLIIIDPVQHSRNAAAALDMESFVRFKKKAALFLKKPSIDFFVRSYLSPEQIQQKYKGKATIVAVQPIEGKEDVSGSALHKAFQHFEAQAANNGFSLKESDWEWDKKGHALLWFVARKEPIDKTFLHPGPPAKFPQHVEKFKKQHKKTMMKGKKIYAVVTREHTTLKSMFSKLISRDEFLKMKGKSYKIL